MGCGYVGYGLPLGTYSPLAHTREGRVGPDSRTRARVPLHCNLSREFAAGEL